MHQAGRFRRLCCSSAAGQVMAAATVLHGGGSLHALAFADGEAQILSASGSVAASARVFETGAPYVCCLQHCEAAPLTFDCAAPRFPFACRWG